MALSTSRFRVVPWTTEKSTNSAMIRLNSSSGKAQNAVALNRRLPASPSKVVARERVSLSIIRYAYFAFIFTFLLSQ